MLRIWLLFVLGIFTVEDGYAQAVTVRTQYEYPARTVTHDISRLQNAANARVVVIRSNQTIVHGDDDGRQVNQAVVLGQRNARLVPLKLDQHFLISHFVPSGQVP